MTEHSDAPQSDAPTLYARGYYECQLHRSHWFLDNRRKHEQRWEGVLRMVAPSQTDVVLDLGCAAGEHAARLAPHVARVIGIDSSAAAIEIARERSKHVPNVEFAQGDATMLARYSDNYADKVMAIDFVEHIDDVALGRMEREIHRVLKPGGRFALYTPSGSHYVERLKARNWVLRQIPGHIAVRRAAAYDRVFAPPCWRVVERFHLPSTYPLFGLVDRALGPLPGIGPLFRFRFCLAVEKARASQ